jgi:hypothetical protein
MVLSTPASLPEFVVCFLDDSHSNWGKMESKCFDLTFLDG